MSAPEKKLPGLPQPRQLVATISFLFLQEGDDLQVKPLAFVPPAAKVMVARALEQFAAMLRREASPIVLPPGSSLQ